jgi:hypothetical protein
MRNEPSDVGSHLRLIEVTPDQVQGTGDPRVSCCWGRVHALHNTSSQVFMLRDLIAVFNEYSTIAYNAALS